MVQFDVSIRDPREMFRHSLLILSVGFFATHNVLAQEVIARKISATEGNFRGALQPGDNFGGDVAELGDLDGDGIPDLAVTSRDVIWILFLNRDGSVRGHRKIEEDVHGIAAAGDLDGDAWNDLAVGLGSGLHLLYLMQDGSYRLSPRLINETSALHVVDDLNDDGLPEFAVGNPRAGGGGRGGVTIYFVDPDFNGVFRRADFGPNIGGFGPIALGDRTGAAIASMEGFGTDSTIVLAVGEPGDDDAGNESGAVWLVELSIPVMLRAGEQIVSRATKIDGRSPGLQQSINLTSQFGRAVADVGDIDGDGWDDLAVGAPLDRGDGSFQGKLWLVFLNPDLSVKASRTIGAGDVDLALPLSNSDFFGSSVAPIGDVNGDGNEDLAVGAPGNEEGGGVWILFGLPALPSEVNLVDLTQTPVLGQDIRVEAEITGPGDIESAELNFRQGGDQSFFSGDMTEGAANRFSYRIPAFAVNSRGVEYFVTTTTAAGGHARAPTRGVVSIPIVVPEGLDIEVPSGSAADSYRLISFPLALDTTDARIVIEKSFGLYDPSEIRFFSLARRETYVELTDGGIELDPGSSYWLLGREDNRILNSGPGTSVPTASPFLIELNQGWTLVGNPFNFSIPAANLSTQSGAAPDIRSYDGSWSVHEDPLEPFGGYAVFSEQDDTLWVDPDLTPDDGSSTTRRPALPAGKIGGSDWTVRLRSRCGSAHDDDNVLGVSQYAEDGRDRFDRPEPPPIGDYLSVYFPHDEWRSASRRFSTDLRSSLVQNQSWTIAVESATSCAVHLSFDDIVAVPAELTVRLVDRAAGVSRDLRIDPQYELVSGSPLSPRTVELVVGTVRGRELPDQPDIKLRVFPNPFARAATLTISVPGERRASLAVFDALGREVVTLLDDRMLESGNTAVLWNGLASNGTPVANGVYLARLEVEGQVLSRGLTISR